MSAITAYRPLDHWRLVRRKAAEVERFQRIMREAEGPSEMTVEHEVDGRCCRREPWAGSLATLHPTDDARKALWV